MQLFFKKPTIGDLALRLEENFKRERQKHWAFYIHCGSTYYRAHPQKLLGDQWSHKKYNEVIKLFESQFEQQCQDAQRYEITSIKPMLTEDCFLRSKQNFSWMVFNPAFAMQDSHLCRIISEGTLSERLSIYNEHTLKAIKLKSILEHGSLTNDDIDSANRLLLELHNTLREGPHRDMHGYCYDLILALGGIFGAPIVFLIAVPWILTAYRNDFRYFGTPEFFWDTLCWFCDSLITAIRCLLFPIAMIHAYNTSGSMNILKGEHTRIVETLMADLTSIGDANNQVRI